MKKKIDIKQALRQAASQVAGEGLDYGTMKKPELDACLADLIRLVGTSGIPAMKKKYKRRIDEINRLLAAMPREGKA